MERTFGECRWRAVYCGAAATFAAAAWLTAAAWPAQAAPRPAPTIIALGTAQPIQTSQGLWTPIVVVDHESPGWYGGGRLNASIYTSTWFAGMTHPAGEALELGYAARLRVTTEGDGTDLYQDGDRAGGSEFQGTAIGTATLFPRQPWRAALELERMQAWFSDGEKTRSGYELPADFGQNEARLSASRHGWLGEEDAEAELTLAAGERDGWEGWALDGDAEASRDYSKVMLHGLQPLTWEGGSNSAFEGWLLGGSGLDLFSGYALGGLTGRYAVGGYFRNEFRAQQAALLHGRHEHRFSQHRRLSVFAHAARLETLEGGVSGDAEWLTLGSAGIGYYHGIAALHGLPVIVRYAEGLLIPDGSREGHRREVVLLVAAAF
jgi:hypothetical protein